MHASIQGPARAWAGDLAGWCKRGLANVRERAARLVKNLNWRRHLARRPLLERLPQAAIVAGALACGLWLNSVAAGLFALVLLFLLWKIGRSLERIAGLLRTQALAAVPAGGRASADAAGQRNIYISAKAVERLRPWVEDESALTEESAKAYCSVLLDTLAMLHPKLAGKASDSWS